MPMDLLGADCSEIIDFVVKLGFPAYRGKQIYHWVHSRGVGEFGDMTNLPQSLREILPVHSYITFPEIVTTSVSTHGDTVKFLLKFADGVMVETVLMIYHPDEGRSRSTICVSTQAGCGMACTFCATGYSGLERNLGAGEILSQVWAGERYTREQGLTPVTNVVYMGMGEPLANLGPVLKSIHLLNQPQGLNIGMRRITLSTCGLVPQIYALGEENIPITLAISLHAPEDALRSRLMPINKKYSTQELLRAAEDYEKMTGRRVTFEYALFHGVNDREEDAQRLGQLLKGSSPHVNLIPANPVAESGLKGSDQKQVEKFRRILASFGVNPVVREERGLDIYGACGQLRRKNKGK